MTATVHAVAAAIAHLLAAAVNIVLVGTLIPLLFGVDPNSMLAGLGGGIFSICTWSFVSAGVGAVGGVLGGALFANKR